MKGSYFIEINTKKINYKFTINRNITIIRGDSATGKTTLSDLIKEYKNSDYISLISKVNCEYLDDRDWLYRINEYKNTIFFVDEESDFILTKEFAREISKGNDNYFVIITRDNLPYLNYSYKEIYEIHNSGKYNYLVRKYDFEENMMLKV